MTTLLPPNLPARSEMERAYLTRDAAFDGLFVTAVRTTRIFCRPTCPARKPFPRNVVFFRTPQEALHAGYRACKRCRPLEESDPSRGVETEFVCVECDMRYFATWESATLAQAAAPLPQGWCSA